MGEHQRTPNEYLALLKRRKVSLFVPFLVVVLIATAVSLTLPPVYKSVSTILIEEQEIPADFAMSKVTSYAEQRLRSIHQRIMSTNRLLEIIKQQDLYADLMGKVSTEEIVGKMRQNIKLEYISTEIVDRRTGQQATATIAFTLSFEAKEGPEKVQKVANILAALFLEENLQVSERQALEATSYLEEELQKIKIRLEEIAHDIAAFKKEHINELPEVLQVNLQSRHAAEVTIERLNDQLRTLQERESGLLADLAGIAPQVEMEETKRLAALKLELASLEARYTDDYPGVVKTRQEIEKLDKNIAGKKVINPNSLPDNPAYINLSSQLSSVRAEMKSVMRQMADLQEKTEKLNRWIEAIPVVEESYDALLAERRNAQAKFDDLSRKLMEANVAYGLEKEQKNERFTLIDSARLPEEPFKPNRLALFLGGIVLGIGVGCASAALMEFLDFSVRRPEVLVRETSFPVLAVIPAIITDDDMRQRTNRRLFWSVTVLLLAAAAVVAFHYLVMDLHIFWAELMRKVM
ncbi:MAG: chain-length determining protein [Pseudomonadota bacterium]